jgi:hypothetical protein
MKILKIRRGYTTNSSAASEFIPPDVEIIVVNPKVSTLPASPPTSVHALPQADQTRPAPIPTNQVKTKDAAVSAPPSAAQSTRMSQNKPAVIPIKPIPAQPKLAGSAEAPAPANLSASPAPASQATSPPQAQVASAPAKPVAAPPQSRGENNTIILATLAGLVAAAFAVERLLRRVLRRKARDIED